MGPVVDASTFKGHSVPYTVFLRREMSIATIDGAVEEVAEEMACPERVIPPPIGVESTLEANGDGPYPASLERRRKEVVALRAEASAHRHRVVHYKLVELHQDDCIAKS